MRRCSDEFQNIDDEMAKAWLEKTSPLWKPKTRIVGPTPFNKTFWSKERCP